MSEELKFHLNKALECINNAKDGLPLDAFYFVSQLTPLINVDLLIKNKTLLRSRLIILFLIFSMMNIGLVFSQCTNTLSGTYTIGVSGNFPTITAAAIQYNGACLSGNVEFILIDSLYSNAESFPIVFANNNNASIAKSWCFYRKWINIVRCIIGQKWCSWRSNCFVRNICGIMIVFMCSSESSVCKVA